MEIFFLRFVCGRSCFVFFDLWHRPWLVWFAESRFVSSPSSSSTAVCCGVNGDRPAWPLFPQIFPAIGHFLLHLSLGFLGCDASLPCLMCSLFVSLGRRGFVFSSIL